MGRPGKPGERGGVRVRRGRTDRGAFPKVRVVTVSECASQAVVDAEIGPVTGAGSGEQAMARRLRARLEADWLLIADRGCYSFESWADAAASGAAPLWRVKADLVLPVLELLPDGSYSSVLFRPRLHDKGAVVAAWLHDIDAAAAERAVRAGIRRRLVLVEAPNGGPLPPSAWRSYCGGMV